MKAILISIKPKWVAKILNGDKTIEIRKTMPKCDLPIDVYIYCTKEEYLYRTNQGYLSSKKPLQVGKGTEYSFAYSDEGKVVAKFTLNKVEDIFQGMTQTGTMFDWEEYLRTKEINSLQILDKSCLSRNELSSYLDYYTKKSIYGYAWHISNLVTFDKPKELSEFMVKDKQGSFKKPYKINAVKYLTKAPQSWCYVEAER